MITVNDRPDVTADNEVVNDVIAGNEVVKQELTSRPCPGHQVRD